MVTSQDKYAQLAALFRAGLSGDARSYTLFLQSLTPILRQIARKKLPTTYEDTVQEILISIHKARHTYDGNRPLMPWLLAIAHFRITDALRKAYSDFCRQGMDIQEVEESFAHALALQTSHESIHEILADVKEREQRILTMMHVEGYTAKETGQHLGMKESAVKVSAHRAIKKLREKMRAWIRTTLPLP